MFGEMVYCQLEVVTVDSLEREIEHFNSIRGKLLECNEGQYALIKGQELIGTFTKMEEAYEEGVKRFGTEPFLIKQILKEDPTETLPALSLGLLRASL